MQNGEFRSCRRVSCTLLSREWKSVTSLVVEMYVCSSVVSRVSCILFCSSRVCPSLVVLCNK